MNPPKTKGIVTFYSQDNNISARCLRSIFNARQCCRCTNSKTYILLRVALTKPDLSDIITNHICCHSFFHPSFVLSLQIFVYPFSFYYSSFVLHKYHMAFQISCLATIMLTYFPFLFHFLLQITRQARPEIIFVDFIG